MACGGCNKNRGNEPPTFKEGSVPNKPMRLLMERNGIKVPGTSEENKEVERRKQNIIMNLTKAGLAQKSPFKWFKDGLSGLIKCLDGDLLYDDDGIKFNRLACKDCEYSTKDDNGNITLKSQCMAPDPKNNGAPCACFITCKTQSDTCPLNKFTTLTIKGINK